MDSIQPVEKWKEFIDRFMKDIIKKFTDEELADIFEIARVGLADDSDHLSDTLDRNEEDLTALRKKLEKVLGTT